ncbi:MAG: hypothetical protein ACXWPM_07905 [Bdellovibrionota bacterium]
MRFQAWLLMPVVLLLSNLQPSFADDAKDEEKAKPQASTAVDAASFRHFNFGVDGGGAFQILGGTVPLPAAGWYVGGNFGYRPIRYIEITAAVDYNGMQTFGNYSVGGVVQMAAGVRFRPAFNYGYYIGVNGGGQVAVGLPTGTALTTILAAIPGTSLEGGSALVGVNMGNDWNLFDSGLTLGWDIHYYFIGGIVGTGLTLKYWL